MTPEQSQALYRWFEQHSGLRRCVIQLDRWLPLIPFAGFPLLIVLLNVRLFRMLPAHDFAAVQQQMSCIARAILVPGLAFWLCTMLRARLDRPRPYEQPGFCGLVQKTAKGQSMPSRHAVSAWVLAVVWLRFYPAVGAVMSLVAAMISALRVLVGVHYVRDVAVGALMGIAIGFAGLWLG